MLRRSLLASVPLIALPSIAFPRQLSGGKPPVFNPTFMPAGDSITVGLYTDGGWRYLLELLLRARGITEVFVGSQTSGAHAGQIQINHDGFSGVSIGGLERNLFGPDRFDLSFYNPPNLLLFIGTNDYQANVSGEGAIIASATISLISTAISLIPDIMVYLALVIPLGNTSINPEIVSGNAILASNYAGNPQVKTVDMYTPFITDPGFPNSVILSSDGVHPTDYGYQLIANQWNAAIP